MGKKCSVCNIEDSNVQFLLERNWVRPQVFRKEYYCQRHLRLRASQLEFIKLAESQRRQLK